LEVGEVWTYICTVNDVTVDFTNTVNAVGTPPIGPDVNDSDTAEVNVLPEIAVTKDASVGSVPETGGSVTFSYTVENIGTVDVTIISLSDDQFGTLAGDADCQVGTNLTPGASCQFDFVTTLSGSAAVAHVNIFTANAEDDDSNQASDDDNAIVEFTPVPSGINKLLSATNSPYTSGSEVAIGEILTYQVGVVFPQGQFANAQLVDTLDRGLAFVGCDSIDATGLTTDIAGSFAGICASPTTDDAGGGTPMDVDRRVTFDFGTLTNNSQSDVTVTVTYRVIVLDTLSNNDGVSLNNTALWSWTGGSIGPVQTEVTLVEPDIQIDKTSNTNSISGGSEVTFTLTISHTSASSADALDAVVTDILPTGLDFVPGTLDCTLGVQDPDVECVFDNSNPLQPTIRAEWSVFALGGGSGQIRFRVTGNASLPANGNVTNVANVEWTSMPGDQTTPDSFSDPANQYATERYYDPGDQVNLYGDSDTLTLRPPGGGGGGGNPTPASSPAPITGSFLIPVTGYAPNVVTDLSNTPFVAYGNTSITLDIPSLSVDIPIVGVPKRNETWNVSWLGNQAGWLEGSAFPSWNGNSVLTSHVTLANGLSGPFANLSKLKYGDQIIVHASGQKFIFEIRTNATVAHDSKTYFRHEKLPWLTLITCKEYDEDTNTYKKRVVVRAVLVEVVDE
jgi:LPXTG-site transpeptidase (sortase) family protein